MVDHPDGLEDLVTRAHVARRLHLSRGRVEAAIGAPGFPAPVGRLGNSVVWRWRDVRAWAEGAAGSTHGPTEEGVRIAKIRDHFREAGFRLKISQDPDGTWRAVRVARGGPSAKGDPFTGDTALEAAEGALEWLQTHR